MNFKNYAIPIALGIVFGVIQNTSLGAIAGIKPNLILMFIITFAFFTRDILQYAIVLFIAVVMVQFATFETSIASTLAMIGLFAYLLRDALPGKMWLNIVASIATGTVLLYILIDISFVGQEFSVIVREAVINSGLGLILYVFFGKVLTNHEKAFKYSI